MRHFVKEYNKRVNEIELYFVFLKGIDSIETHKNSKVSLPNKSTLKIDRDLQKVLRSYCFLLLYNLIESTLSNGITEIFDNIHDDKLNFKGIAGEFKKVWLDINGKKISQLKNEEKIIDVLNTIISECNDVNEINFDKSRLSISGNLDFKTIQKIRLKYGFKGEIPNKDVKQLKSVLNLIKVKRNHLGHGNESFTQASELKTYNDLVVIKNEVIIYLSSIVKSIDELLSKQSYRAKV